MLKLTLLLFLFSFTAHAQTMLETAFIPVYDSTGEVICYIKKSDSKKYDQPKKNIKIFCFNSQIDTLGYWVGDKKKYVSMLPKKK